MKRAAEAAMAMASNGGMPFGKLTPEETQQLFLLRQRPEFDLLFRELDDRHFGGMLTARGWLVGIHDLSKESDDFIVVKRPGAAGAWAYCRRIPIDADGFTMPPPWRLILIGQHLDPGVTRFAGWIRQTVLHEIAHAAVSETSKTIKPLERQGPHGSHGRRFLAELKRLVAGGERTLREEVLFLSYRLGANKPELSYDALETMLPGRLCYEPDHIRAEESE